VLKHCSMPNLYELHIKSEHFFDNNSKPKLIYTFKQLNNTQTKVTNKQKVEVRVFDYTSRECDFSSLA
jgi:hypothetical protein